MVDYHLHNSWYTGSCPTFIDNGDDATAKILKENYADIRNEILQNFDQTLDQLKSNYTPYGADISGWRSINFYTYFLKYPENCKKFPVVDRIVNQIPHKCMAMISVLKPGTKIPPHIGDTDGIIRHHLAIQIPSEDVELAGLQVRRDKKNWTEGEVLSFCNMHRHTAWNFTEEHRVVLIVDTIRPDLTAKKYDVAAKTLAVILMKHIARSIPRLKKMPKIFTEIIHAIMAALFRIVLFIERRAPVHLMALTKRDNQTES